MMEILSQNLDELPGVRPTMYEGEINFMYMTDEGVPQIDFTDPITRDYVWRKQFRAFKQLCAYRHDS